MTVDSVGHMFKGTIPQITAILAGTLLFIADGMAYCWTAPYVPYLISEGSHIKTTKQEAEWLETALLLGSTTGFPITMYLVDKIGRKKCMLLASFIATIGWAVVAFANRIEHIFIARYFWGISENMAVISAPMYVAEIADKKIRGCLTSLIYTMVTFGCLIVYCIGPFLPFYVTPIIAITVIVLELALFPFMPESSHYLLYKNKSDDAKKSLEYFKPKADIEEEIKEISQVIEKQKEERGKIQDLILVDSNRKAILILTVLNLGQHLCAYTVILMNLHLILEAAGSVYIEYPVAAIIFAAIMLAAAIIASFQIDKYGRKVLLIFSSVLTGICLLAIAIYFNLQYLQYDVLCVNWIPIVFVMVYAAVIKLGVTVVPTVVAAEMFPTKLKAMGMATADAMFIIGGILSIQIYLWLSSFYGLHVAFYLFSLCSFILAVFTFFLVPETKGKSLDEIQQILKGNKPSENVTYKLELNKF